MLKRFATVNVFGTSAYLLGSVLGYWACLGNAAWLTIKPAFGIAAVIAWYYPSSLLGVAAGAFLSYLVGLHAGPLDAGIFGLTQALGAGCIRPLYTRMARSLSLPKGTDSAASWLWLGLAVIAGAAIASLGNTWFLSRMDEPVMSRITFFALAGAVAGLSAVGTALHFANGTGFFSGQRTVHNLALTLGVLLVLSACAPWLEAQGTLAMVGVVTLGAGILLLDGGNFCLLAFSIPLLCAHYSAGSVTAPNLLLGEYRTDVPLFLLTVLGLVVISQRERGLNLARKLDEQARHAATVISALPDLVTVQNREGDYVVTLSTNHQFANLPQNLSGRNVRDFMPEDYANQRVALVARVIDSQRAETEQIPVTVDGKGRWLEARAVPYAEGLCIVLCRDITAEHEALERLKASEAHNRSVIEALNDVVVVQNRDGVPVVDLSGPGVVHKVSTQQWLRQPLESFLPAEVAHRVQNVVRTVLSGGEPKSLEVEVAGKRATAWYNVRVVPYSDGQVLTAVRDVTAEHIAREEVRHHTQMMALIEGNMRDVVIIQDKFGSFSYVSPSCRKTFGLEPAWLTEARFLERVSHQDLKQLVALRADITSGVRASARLEFQFRHHNGELLWISQELVPVKDDEGNVTHVLSAARDVTEQKDSYDQLRLAKTAVDGIREGLMVTDSEGAILWTNRRYTEITGYSDEESYERNEAGLLVSDFTPLHRLEERKLALKQDGVWSGELMTRRKDGTTFSEYRTMSTVMTEDGNEVVLSLMTDLSEERAREENLWHASTHDSLTNLATSKFFLEALDHAGTHARKFHRKFAVLTIGLNRFGQICESYGRLNGEQFLKDVSERLTNGLRDEDMVARLSDSVFAVLSEEMKGTADISAQASRLIHLFDAPFKVDGEDVYESPSIGISVYPEHSVSADELLSHSRSALEEARAVSTPVYRFYSTNLHVRERERIRLETSLRRALLEGSELSLVYQPEISFETGRILGFEALCRWKSERLGDVSPDIFIPLAEASGLIDDLGTWSITTVCERLKVWQNAGLHQTSISVNLSPKQLRASALVPQIVAALERANLDPHLLQLEITEASLKEGLNHATGVLRQLKDIGVRLVLDDFGKGYSNLTQLQELPLDGIKIDGRFVNSLATKASAVAICEGVIRMAHAMGVRTIAKSVETDEQHRILKKLGCDAFQGYLFSPAVSEMEARALLAG